ncbi:MAG: hypothetical protein J2P37_13290 [Ktedonobacteraceae bacterium]|nr:hypothetical protein [Ktedonobacteraceae bacterium]
MERRTSQRSGYVPVPKQAQVRQQDVFDQEYDDIWPSRPPTSVRRYRGDVGAARTTVDVRSTTRDFPVTQPGRRSSIPARSTASMAMRTSASQTNVPALTNTRRKLIETDDMVARRGKGSSKAQGQQHARFHWLFYVGLAMLVMTLLWAGLNIVGGWWQTVQDDWHYGRPRTVHADAVVGHNDSAASKSHFIAINLNRHVQVIEFPGGDSSKAKIYVGPVLVGNDQDLAVPKLDFRDVNDDGKPDMIISIGDSRYVFLNENGAFRALRTGEQIHL